MCTNNLNAILLLIFITQSFLLAQPTGSGWKKTFPISVTSEPNVALNLLTDPSGNVFVTGWIMAQDTSRDIATVKYDGQGNRLWDTAYQSTDYSIDQPTAIVMDGQGNLIVIGFTWNSVSDYDFLAIKYNQNGDTLWSRKYNGNGNSIDQAFLSIVDVQSNIYVAGSSIAIGKKCDAVIVKYNSDGANQKTILIHDSTEAYYEPTNLKMDSQGNLYLYGSRSINQKMNVFLTKVEATTGTILWTKQLSPVTSVNDEPADMVIDKNDNLYLLATTYTTRDNSDILLMKVNIDGGTVWTKIYDDPEHLFDYGTSLVHDKNSNIIVAGSSETSAGKMNYRIIQYDPNGVQKWVKQYQRGTDTDDFLTGICIDGNDNIFVTGRSDGSTDGRHIVTVKYDKDGNFTWDSVIDHDKKVYARPYRIVSDTSGNIYLCGYIKDENGKQSYIVVKNTNLITALEDKNEKSKYGFWLAQNYPNPFNPSTTFRYSVGKDCDVKLTIVNVLGVEVAKVTDSFQSEGVHEVQWANTDLPSGLYFYRLTAEKYISMKKLVILNLNP